MVNKHKTQALFIVCHRFVYTRKQRTNDKHMHSETECASRF